MTVEIEENPRATSTINEERLQHIKLIRKWGGITSDALLDPACYYYMENGIEGLVGYKLENNTAVVFGDPVCDPKVIPALVASFHNYTREKNWNTLYISASEKFARWAVSKECAALIQFGEEFFIDPHNDPRKKKGTHASLVRRKVRHAEHEGTTVHEYLEHNEQLEKAIDEVGILWLEGRRGPQIHISNVRLFNDRHGKRWFYAQQNKRVVGAAVLNRLEKDNGWLLNHIVFTPDAPGGTPELLVTTALEAAAHEGCHYVTFGNSPASKLGETLGFSTVSSYLARAGYSFASKFFHLGGHKVFWDKFAPDSRPSYLLFTQPKIGLKELRALVNALNVSL